VLNAQTLALNTISSASRSQVRYQTRANYEIAPTSASRAISAVAELLVSHGLHFCCRLYMPISILLGIVSCKSWQVAKNSEKIRVTWVQGHSRSSNLAPIERACTTSY